jgi:hypothetical protein
MLKVVSNKLAATQNKVKKEWQKYETSKTRILKRKGLSKAEKTQIINSELDLTRQRISSHYQNYKEFKFSIGHKSEFEGFKHTNNIKTKYTSQRIYKAQKDFDTDNLDTTVEKALYSDPKITGILVVFEVENEQGLKSYVSNYITKGLLSSIQEVAELKDMEFGEGVIFDFVTQRIEAGYKENLKLKFIYMRIIYEDAKNSNK